jgi:multimeric flavodoxin WrbA
MSDNVNRRGFLGAAAATAAVFGVAREVGAEEVPGGGEAAKGLKIIAVNCSARKGKTTAAALQICLDAAKAVSPKIETQLIEVAGLKMDPPAQGQEDEWASVVKALSDPQTAGIIVGSPVYYSNMSAVCKVFLERLGSVRKAFTLSNKVGGVVAVAGARNGGQEQTIRSIQATLMAHEMIVVGDGRPAAHQGATLQNTKDDISGDEWGINTAKGLGKRVAEVALKMAGMK